MKKIKMFAAAAIFCATAFAGYTAYEQATMTDTERIILANIEALTYDIEDVVVSCSSYDAGCGDCYYWNGSECVFNGYQMNSCKC